MQPDFSFIFVAHLQAVCSLEELLRLKVTLRVKTFNIKCKWVGVEQKWVVVVDVVVVVGSKRSESSLPWPASLPWLQHRSWWFPGRYQSRHLWWLLTCSTSTQNRTSPSEDFPQRKSFSLELLLCQLTYPYCLLDKALKTSGWKPLQHAYDHKTVIYVKDSHSFRYGYSRHLEFCFPVRVETFCYLSE